jgi:hypothetical protein
VIQIKQRDRYREDYVGFGNHQQVHAMFLEVEPCPDDNVDIKRPQYQNVENSEA